MNEKEFLKLIEFSKFKFNEEEKQKFHLILIEFIEIFNNLTKCEYGINNNAKLRKIQDKPRADVINAFDDSSILKSSKDRVYNREYILPYPMIEDHT